MPRRRRHTNKPAPLSPQRGILVLPDGREVPLLPVYVGRRPCVDGSGDAVDTWILWVHPDWPESSISFSVIGPSPRMSVDLLPQHAQLTLHMEVDYDGGVITVRRHAG